MNKTAKPIVIVGGGWAGLAAGVELARHRLPFILLESAKQLGGRARSVAIDGRALDNGQHLLLGAYESTLDLLRTIGIQEEQVLLRQPLSLHLHWPNGRAVKLSTPRLPAPLHLAWGLLSARGLSLRERLSAMRFSQAIQRQKFELAEDISVAELLQQHRQSPVLIEALWEPLCLGALNTPINAASAQVFLRTLGDSFQHHRSDSDLLLTRQDLGAILPEPALDYMERHGGSVRLGQRVSELKLDGMAICGLVTSAGDIDADKVILTTPANATRQLVEPHPPLYELHAQLAHLSHSPICTVYLQYPETTRLGTPLRGSLGTTAQWIFDRRIYGQAGLMAVVISADGEHMGWDNDALCDHVEQELAKQLPHWPAALSRHVIREKRATLASRVDVNRHRPGSKTTVSGLWLAGDYTATGLPATLEGAVRSGLVAAQQIIHTVRSQGT